MLTERCDSKGWQAVKSYRLKQRKLCPAHLRHACKALYISLWYGWLVACHHCCHNACHSCVVVWCVQECITWHSLLQASEILVSALESIMQYAGTTCASRANLSKTPATLHRHCMLQESCRTYLQVCVLPAVWDTSDKNSGWLPDLCKSWGLLAGVHNRLVNGPNKKRKQDRL